jgi:hypothetical protein
MLCGTPLIWAHRNDPSFCIRFISVQEDGSNLVEDLYPYDGRWETHIVPKGVKIT